jgi:hypothetical protein
MRPDYYRALDLRYAKAAGAVACVDCLDCGVWETPKGVTILAKWATPPHQDAALCLRLMAELLLPGAYWIIDKDNSVQIHRPATSGSKRVEIIEAHDGCPEGREQALRCAVLSMVCEILEAKR